MELRSTPPKISADFQDPAFYSDPYPTLLKLRELGPVVFHEPSQKYMVTTYRECAKVLGNAENFKPAAEDFRSLFGGDTMSGMEGKNHRRTRGIWARYFGRIPLQVHQAMVADTIRSQVSVFVERVRAGETVEAVSTMTRAITTLVIAHLLGIPAEDRNLFCLWSDGIAGLAEGMVNKTPRGEELRRKGLEATKDLNEYVARSIDSHAGRNDLIGIMLVSPASGELTISEKVASVTQLVFAGNETTAKLMATTLYALGQFPRQRALLRAEPGLALRAVEEVNRWQSVVQGGWRVAGPDAAIAGMRIPEKAPILILLGLANRDPERWTSPETFDISREYKPHLGFGFGAHTCLGMNLARFEVETWVAQLLEALPDWELEAVDWGLSFGSARGPVTIHVRAA